jgi:hypothetical protein
MTPIPPRPMTSSTRQPANSSPTASCVTVSFCRTATVPPMPAAFRAASATVACALCAALLVSGCGTAAGPPPGPKITLKLTAPVDESRVPASSATVAGTVTPARARVEVLGRAVPLERDGSFSVRIALSVGTNLIDVEASAPRSAGAVAAVRVIRFLLVTVPSVVGESPKQAATSLKALGLTVKTQGSSDPFNFLIPGSSQVCSISPPAGARVDPGTTITLKTSKFCGF